jgi:hypothetical protein
MMKAPYHAAYRAVHAAADEALIRDLCEACDVLGVAVQPHSRAVVTWGLGQVPTAESHTTQKQHQDAGVVVQENGNNPASHGSPSLHRFVR